MKEVCVIPPVNFFLVPGTKALYKFNLERDIFFFLQPLIQFPVKRRYSQFSLLQFEGNPLQLLRMLRSMYKVDTGPA